MLFAVEGPIARTPSDLALGLEAMAKPDLRDAACVPAPFTRDAPLERGATLGLYRGGDGAPVDASHLAALERMAGWLRGAGFTLAEIDVPQLAEAQRLYPLLLLEDLRPELDNLRAFGGDATGRWMDQLYTVEEQLWPTPTFETYLAGHVRRTALIAEMQDLLERYPVILMPASGVPIPDHDADLYVETAGPLIAGQWPNLAVPLLGLPALTLPAGIEDGLPTGVQLLGGRFRESWLLDVAEAVEPDAPSLTPIDPR
jgi:amidase